VEPWRLPCARARALRGVSHPTWSGIPGEGNERCRQGWPAVRLRRQGRGLECGQPARCVGRRGYGRAAQDRPEPIGYRFRQHDRGHSPFDAANIQRRSGGHRHLSEGIALRSAEAAAAARLDRDAVDDLRQPRRARLHAILQRLPSAGRRGSARHLSAARWQSERGRKGHLHAHPHCAHGLEDRRDRRTSTRLHDAGLRPPR
jgi:hypothetical protein